MPHDEPVVPYRLKKLCDDRRLLIHSAAQTTDFILNPFLTKPALCPSFRSGALFRRCMIARVLNPQTLVGRDRCRRDRSPQTFSVPVAS